MGDEGSRLFDEFVIARQRHRNWAAVAVAVLVMVRLFAEFVPMMSRPDLALLDFWQSLRGTEKPSPQIVIVAIDEKSVAHFGPPAWPRSDYVPLIDRLANAGARVIALDFTFAALERESANNALLAAAMRKAGNVVFGYEFTDIGSLSPPLIPPSAVMQANALSHFQSLVIPPAPRLIEPEPSLAEAAAALGHVGTIASEDGRIRFVPLFIQHGEKAYPSLALQIARVYAKTPTEKVELRSGVVRLGMWEIPVSDSGELLLGWPAGGEQSFPQYSFLDVVRGEVPDAVFHDKAVLVVGTSWGLDDRDFPFAVEAPGGLIYATFLDNVFRFDFLHAPTWAFFLEWGLFLAACGLGVWLFPRLSTRLILIAVLTLAAFLFGVAAFLFVQKGIWIKVVYPSLALLVPLGSMAAHRLTATREAVAEKLETQKLLALSFQEKGMLDMALATFNKLPFSQDMKHVYLNLGLDYENRGQRDKAFLVYKKIFDIDPAFEDVAARMARLGQGGAAESSPPVPAPSDSPMSCPRADSSDPCVETPTPVWPFSARVRPAPAGAPMADVPYTSGSVPSGSAAEGIAIANSSPVGLIRPGSRFSRYEVEQYLGGGAMGDVYLVRDTVINRKAALKTIRGDTGLNAQQVIKMRQRFYREAQTAGKLAHPNIVTVYDVGEDLGLTYIVMELVEGSTLAQLMEKKRLSLPQIEHVISSAALGLDHAHQNGVFHRDVKPDNILVSKTGMVKVMDFGIARIVESNLTKTGSLIGTPSYMSPEQVHGEKIDGRSDIFSLGVVLYELLTGKKPFTGETMSSLMFEIMHAEPTPPSAIDSRIDATWDEILRKALSKEPESRYATAGEFAQAVRNAPVR